MPLTVREMLGRKALASVGPAFDRLAGDLQLPVTARRRWLQAWIDTHPHWCPWLLVAEEDGELAGLAALARRRRRGLHEIVMLGHGPTDDARLPVRTSQAASVLGEAFRRGLPEWAPWRLRLQQLPDGDPVAQGLLALLPHARFQAGQGLPVVDVVESDPDRYLSRNTRKALAKIRNRLSRRGLTPELTWTTDPAEIVALVPDLMRVHRERDLALGRRPDFADASAAAFYREVITRHARAGEMEVLTLRLENDLAAYVCAFRDGRTLRSWDNRLSPRWANLSAGRLANSEAIRYVAQSPEYDRLDWMRGEEPYKLQSATWVVPAMELRAWSSAGLRRAEESLAWGGAAARSLVGRSERLDRFARRARRALPAPS